MHPSEKAYLDAFVQDARDRTSESPLLAAMKRFESGLPPRTAEEIFEDVYGDPPVEVIRRCLIARVTMLIESAQRALTAERVRQDRAADHGSAATIATRQRDLEDALRQATEFAESDDFSIYAREFWRFLVTKRLDRPHLDSPERRISDPLEAAVASLQVLTPDDEAIARDIRDWVDEARRAATDPPPPEDNGDGYSTGPLPDGWCNTPIVGTIEELAHAAKTTKPTIHRRNGRGSFRVYRGAKSGMAEMYSRTAQQYAERNARLLALRAERKDMERNGKKRKAAPKKKG